MSTVTCNSCDSDSQSAQRGDLLRLQKVHNTYPCSHTPLPLPRKYAPHKEVDTRLNDLSSCWSMLIHLAIFEFYSGLVQHKHQALRKKRFPSTLSHACHPIRQADFSRPLCCSSSPPQALSVQSPASDISQIVSHLLSAAPLESADAYILLRSQFLSNEAKPRCLHCSEEGASCACGRASGQLKMEMAVNRNLANARASSPQASSSSESLGSDFTSTDSACCPPTSLLNSSSSIASGSSNSNLLRSSSDTTTSSSNTSSSSSSNSKSKSVSASHVAADSVNVPLSQPSPTEQSSCSMGAVEPTPTHSTAFIQSMCSKPTNASPNVRNSCCDNLDDSAYAANTDNTTFLPPTAQALVLDELCSLPLYQVILEQLTASRAVSSQALQDTHASTHPGSVNTPHQHTIPGSLNSSTPGPAGVRTGPDSSEDIVSSILNATVHGKVRRQISLQVLAAKATLLLLIVPGDAWSAPQSGDDESPSESSPQPIRSSHVHNDNCGNDCGSTNSGSRVVDVLRSAESNAMILRWRHMLDLSSLSMLAGEVQYLREQFAHLASLQHAPKPCLVSVQAAIVAMVPILSMLPALRNVLPRPSG